jgi:type III restriction enzyme
MELKEYQKETLKNLETYLTELAKLEQEKREDEARGRRVRYDVFEEAWKEVRKSGNYRTRKNGLGESIPQICFKVPTGGGKTLLASRSIDLINTVYLKRRSLMVLWIVPSEIIYQQTLKALRNREHPYREALNRAGGGNVQIFEKTEHFNLLDLENKLAVLLLMLPSANRQNKETLKIFQDASGFEDFFPPEDSYLKNAELLKQVPNLDHYSVQGNAIKTSLGNTLRLLKPLVILDEGHKAYSEGAQETLRSFNPCFVLELSATPNDQSNVLVSISGQALNREEMIKLDLNVINDPQMDWKATLAASIKQLDLLQEKADHHRQRTGVYIRPICLIQVERTGKDQQNKGNLIHAFEVREELLKYGVGIEAIAIKSAENNELEQVDLLSDMCPVRFIITRSALQEGWDCPFAYVLTILTNPASNVSITQLVGRVLRQPYARKTKVKELDESYVYCFRQKAREILDAIRKSFDDEGMSDLMHRVYAVEESELETVRMREKYRHFEGKLYLPRLMVHDNAVVRELSYERDILRWLNWDKIPLEQFDPVLGFAGNDRVTIGINLEDNSHAKIFEKTRGEAEAVELPINPVFVSLQLAEVVPNAWTAYHFAKQVLDKLIEKEGREKVANNLIEIIKTLRNFLATEKDKLAQQVFNEMINAQKLSLVVSVEHGYLIPDSITVRKTAQSRQLVRSDNSSLQLSLFDKVYQDDLNEPEQDIAVYLNGQEQLILWWARNYSRKDYSLKGWREEKIYPDFMVARLAENNPAGFDKLLIIETKGEHLEGNDDTTYKQTVFQVCNTLAQEWEKEPEFKEQNNARVEFLLTFHSSAKSDINRSLIAH